MRLILDQLELTAIVSGDHLLVTTPDAADQIMLARLYRLPASLGSGIPSSDDENSWIDLITSTVATNAWHDMGGTGHVEPLPGALMVVTTNETHERVAALLRQFERPLLPDGRSFFENLGSADELRIQAALGRPASVFFKDMPLREAMKHLQDEHGIPISINVRKLEEAGVPADTRITKTLRDVSLGTVLRTVLDELELVYVIRDGVLQITTPEDAESQVQTVVYDVHELLDGDPGERDFDSLIDLVSSAVAPQFWDEGSGPGQINGFGDSWLVFHQTQEVHAQVAALLSQLRAHLQPAVSGDELLPALSGQDSPASAKAQAALEREIVLDWGTLTLGELCDNLSETLGINVVCNLHRLEEIAVPADVLIDCRLPKMPLWQALDMVLEPLGVQAVVRDELLQITSQEDVEGHREIRIYDVRSFDPGPSRFDPASSRNDALIEVLTKSLRPRDWSGLGGPGDICRYRGLLVVSHTPPMQRQVRHLLRLLRQVAEADAENRSKPD